MAARNPAKAPVSPAKRRFQIGGLARFWGLVLAALLVTIGDRLWLRFRPVKIVQIRVAAMPESLKRALGATGSNLLNQTEMPYRAATNGPITPKDLRQIRAVLTWQRLAPFHA